MVKRLIGAAVVGGVAIFGGAQSFDDNTTRDESGEITESGGLGVMAIQIGDCLQLPDALEVTSVEAVPCAEPHDAQAFGEATIVSGDAYVEDVVWEAAINECYPKFAGFVGTSYEESELYFDVFYPSPEGWEAGDRSVTCMLLPAEIDGQLVGDMQNSGR